MKKIVSSPSALQRLKSEQDDASIAALQAQIESLTELVQSSLEIFGGSVRDLTERVNDVENSHRISMLEIEKSLNELKKSGEVTDEEIKNLMMRFLLLENSFEYLGVQIEFFPGTLNELLRELQNLAKS